MKEKLITYAKHLLSVGSYVELATHDEFYVEKFISEIIHTSDIGSDKFEIQFLYGVPRSRLQKRLKDGGYLVRLYMPFGDNDSAGPYCKRRLKSNPNLFVYGLKNIMHIG